LRGWPCELTKNLIRLTKTEGLAVQVHQFAICLGSLLTHFTKEENVISDVRYQTLNICDDTIFLASDETGTSNALTFDVAS